MQRTILGILAAILIIGGSVLWLSSQSSTGLSAIAGACLRIGVVLGAIWLAMPNVTHLFARVPPWLLFATLAIALVVAVRPQSAMMLLPILAVLWAIGPNWLSRKK